MPKILKIEQLKNYRVAWCDDYRGYMLHSKNKLQEGDKLDDNIHYLHDEIRKEVEKWMKRGVKPLRSMEYKTWILDLFKTKTIIEVEKIKDEAFKKGYSWQVVQRVRRDRLADKVKFRRSKSRSNSWVWYRVKV